MFMARQGAGRSGAGSLLHWRTTRRPRLRLPASGIEFGYIALTAAFAAIIGVALVSFTTTSTNTKPVPPALAYSETNTITINAATTGTNAFTGGTGQITGSQGMSSTLIHNLGARSAVISAAGRF